MPRLNPGVLQTWVDLDELVPDGTPVLSFEPSRIKVRLRPSGIADERAVGWIVDARYHAQVTTHTRLTLDDGRQLFVRGFDNAGNVDRSGWFVLQCEEVLTP
jgi:hypothetical protein